MNVDPLVGYYQVEARRKQGFALAQLGLSRLQQIHALFEATQKGLTGRQAGCRAFLAVCLGGVAVLKFIPATGAITVEQAKYFENSDRPGWIDILDTTATCASGVLQVGLGAFTGPGAMLLISFGAVDLASCALKIYQKVSGNDSDALEYTQDALDIAAMARPGIHTYKSVVRASRLARYGRRSIMSEKGLHVVQNKLLLEGVKLLGLHFPDIVLTSRENILKIKGRHGIAPRELQRILANKYGTTNTSK